LVLQLLKFILSSIDFSFLSILLLLCLLILLLNIVDDLVLLNISFLLFHLEFSSLLLHACLLVVALRLVHLTCLHLHLFSSWCRCAVVVSSPPDYIVDFLHPDLVLDQVALDLLVYFLLYYLCRLAIVLHQVVLTSFCTCLT